MPQILVLICILLSLFIPISDLDSQVRVLTQEQLYSEIGKSKNEYKLRQAKIKDDNFSSDTVLDFRDKDIEFEDVHFENKAYFSNVVFGSLSLKNCSPVMFWSCTFRDKFKLTVDSVNGSNPIEKTSSNIPTPKYDERSDGSGLNADTWFFWGCLFSKYIPTIKLNGSQKNLETGFYFSDCSIRTEGFNNNNGDFDWYFNNINAININKNEFIFNKALTDIIEYESHDNFSLKIDRTTNFVFSENQIERGISIFDFNDIEVLSFDFNNTDPLMLNIDKLEKEDNFYISNANNLYSLTNYQKFFTDIEHGLTNNARPELWFQRDSLYVFRNFIISREDYISDEMSFFGTFEKFYKEKKNVFRANIFYVYRKFLETQRYQFLYNTDKSFQNYFQWKINQFLRVFSDYGTRPAKAIVKSIYVIFIFAIFYFFFPNSWDENNRHRVMNRMLFFTKYFKRKEGMKEVYEEERKAQIMAYEDFKSFITESKNEIPPYFVALSKPIYAFSVANFKIHSKVLSKADILKGKWAELSPRRKAVTSIIMAFWLLGILLYDVFVKFFNALMLSINTFSTLGFGEIPIKGLPRYLAILQGFLGWFMLSIFSVSLISQLLN